MIGATLYTGLLAAYTAVASLLGLVGNGLVLHASVNKTAFKLDKITLLLIQNLALSDFLYLLIVIVPSFNAYFGGTWNLGDTMCYVIGFVGTWLASANLHFILFVTAHRLFNCIMPWKMKIFERRQKFGIIAVVIWAFSSLKMVVLSANGTQIRYNANIYRCGVDYVEFGKHHPLCLILLWVFAKWVPFTLIMILNILLFLTARKRFKKTTTKGLMAIISISILLVLSWTPAQVYSIMGAVKYPNKQVVAAAEIAAYNFYLVSVFGNPIIYGLQNKYFAAFVRGRIKKIARSINSTITGK